MREHHSPRDSSPRHGGGASNFRPSSTIVPFNPASELLAEADHRIANHLALLAGQVRLKVSEVASQSAEPDRESVRRLLQGFEAQVDAIARLHRGLAVNGPQGRVDLSEALHAICMSFSVGLFGAVVVIEDFPPQCSVRPDQLVPLTQIVAEVVTNAVKHAYADGRGGVILVRCRKDATGDLRIDVVDHGPGLPEGFDPETDGGFGFRLVRALGRKLGAPLAFESTPAGLSFRLSVATTAASRTPVS